MLDEAPETDSEDPYDHSVQPKDLQALTYVKTKCY